MSARSGERPQEPLKDFREGRIIVNFKDGVTPSVSDGEHSREGNVELREFTGDGTMLLVAISPDQTVSRPPPSTRSILTWRSPNPTFA